MNNSHENNVRQFLKGMSKNEFLRIGMDEIAYVRALRVEGRDEKAFGVFAADGTQLSVLDNMDMAIATMRHNDLLPITVH